MVVKRLKQFIDKKGINVAAFEKSVGFSNAAFRKLLDSNGSIRSNKLEKILQKYPDLNPVWLMTGKGKMQIGYEEQDIATNLFNESYPLYGEYQPIPLVASEEIADFIYNKIEAMDFNIKDRYVIPDLQSRGVKFLIRVLDSSMHPTYPNGSILACRPIEDQSFFQWNKVYVLDTDQGLLIKRLHFILGEPDFFECRSDNQDNLPFSINKKSIKGIYIVAGAILFE